MRRAVRAIIIRDGNLLVMHRNKFGKQYYTLPGGNIEMGETPEQAVFRELHEETMVTVANPILKFVEEAGDPYGTQYVFHCEYISGDPRLHEDSEEAQINKLGQNLHTPQWITFADLATEPFVSEKLKQAILLAVKQGFPDKALEIH